MLKLSKKLAISNPINDNIKALSYYNLIRRRFNDDRFVHSNREK